MANQPKRPKSTAVAVLSKPRTTFWKVPPLEQIEYLPRASIGIMRRKLEGGVVWYFVSRRDGRTLFGRWFDEARHFEYGYAAVRVRDRWHFINARGVRVCREQFLEVGHIDCHHQVAVLHPRFCHPVTGKPEWRYFTITRY